MFGFPVGVLLSQHTLEVLLQKLVAFLTSASAGVSYPELIIGSRQTSQGTAANSTPQLAPDCKHLNGETIRTEEILTVFLKSVQSICINEQLKPKRACFVDKICHRKSCEWNKDLCKPVITKSCELCGINDC